MPISTDSNKSWGTFSGTRDLSLQDINSKKGKLLRFLLSWAISIHFKFTYAVFLLKICKFVNIKVLVTKVNLVIIFRNVGHPSQRIYFSNFQKITYSSKNDVLRWWKRLQLVRGQLLIIFFIYDNISTQIIIKEYKLVPEISLQGVNMPQ